MFDAMQIDAHASLMRHCHSKRLCAGDVGAKDGQGRNQCKTAQRTHGCISILLSATYHEVFHRLVILYVHDMFWTTWVEDATLEPTLDADGLPVSRIGEWSLEKHGRLRKYVDISRGVRRKFIDRAGATYIDLYCGPGRSLIRETDKIVDGSPLIATEQAIQSNAPFTSVFISDLDKSNVEAALTRLGGRNVAATHWCGTADAMSLKVAAKLSPHALHFAFLDPFNLGDLPFSVIETLAAFKRMDLLIHVSAQDLQRNLGRYLETSDSPLDRVAPGWRKVVDPRERDDIVRIKLLQHWLGLIRRLDMAPSQGIELVSGSKNQRLYWLVFVSRHERADEFWNKIRNINAQGRLEF